MGSVTIYLVPSLKYPANPPAVGDPETIGLHIGLYLGMILISLLAAVAAGKLRVSLLPRLGAWNAALAAGFPAAVLWQFRVASIGAQALMWASIGLLFGPLAERLLAERLLAGPARRRAERLPAAT